MERERGRGMSAREREGGRERESEREGGRERERKRARERARESEGEREREGTLLSTGISTSKMSAIRGESRTSSYATWSRGQ